MIAGTIGAGKTTLAESLCQENPDWVLCPEPLQENPFFDDFYSGDPATLKAVALKMQLWILVSRVQNLHDILSCPASHASRSGRSVVVDRSPYEDRIFARVLQKRGVITLDELELYDRMFDTLVQALSLEEHQVEWKYLRVTPEVAMGRILGRARKGEENITLGYLQDLHDEYEKEFSRLAEFSGK